MIFIKNKLNKDGYNMISKNMTPEQLYRFSYMVAYHNKYVSCKKNLKKCALKIINNKYYLIMVIESKPTNSYVDTGEKENSEALQKFYEWADKIMEELE